MGLQTSPPLAGRRSDKNDGDMEVSKIFITPKVRDLEDGELTDAESLVDSTPEEGELSKSLC